MTEQTATRIPTADETTRARRILILADAIDATIAREVRLRAAADAEVIVVAPPLTTRAAYWADAVDGPTAAARERLDAVVGALRADGIDARGEIGDPDPLLALDDAVATTRPDAILIVSGPPDASTWLEHGLVTAARKRFDLPITHLLVGDARDAQLVPASDEPRAHGRRTGLAIAVTLLLLVLSPLLWILGGALGWASTELVAFALVLDLGVKAIWLVLVGVGVLAVARADRLDV